MMIYFQKKVIWNMIHEPFFKKKVWSKTENRKLLRLKFEGKFKRD
jgi:hypothetical protein